MPIAGYLTTEQVAERLGVTRGTVAVAIRQGRLRAERVGRSWLVPEVALAESRVYPRAGRPRAR